MIALAWWQGLFVDIPSSYLALLAGFALLALIVYAASRQLQERIGLSPARFLVGVGVVAFVCYCGPAVAFASVMLMLAAIAATPERWVRSADGEIASLVAGLAILASVVGWLLPLPVHATTAYLALATLFCAYRREVIRRRLGGLLRGWVDLERNARGWLVFAVAAGCMAGLGLWLPSMNYDDNAAHLILPYQLLQDGYYHLDVSTQAWAVAPWANNVLNGIAALFAGREARAAVNVLWLLIGLDGAWRVARALGADPRVALAASAAYAGLPLTAYFTTTMQVDAASAAVLMQLAALLVASGRSLPPPMLTGAFMGLLAGLKATNAVFALPAIAWLGWLALRNRGFGWLAKVAAVALLLGASSYCYSMLVTGNPFFPLFNATFQSPYFPSHDLVDMRWKHQLSWNALWGMTFHTDLYGEHYRGAFGVSLLALLPALAIEIVRRPASRAVVAWFLLSGVLMFVQMQYIRYLFPATAVLVIVGVVGLGRLLPARLFAVSLAALVVVGAMLVPTTSWLLHDDPWRKLIMEGPSASAAIESERVPERAVIRRLLAESPQACIIVANQEAPFGAIAGGQAVVVKEPYDSRMAAAYAWANADATGRRWGELLATTGASHVITGTAMEPALQQALVARGFQKIDVQGGAAAWASLDSASRRCSGNLEQVRDEARRHFRLRGAP